MFENHNKLDASDFTDSELRPLGFNPAQRTVKKNSCQLNFPAFLKYSSKVFKKRMITTWTSKIQGGEA